MRTFLDSVFAGLCIALGGFIYLSSADKTIGAFLFSIGLIAVLIFRFNLFTGKVCSMEFLKSPLQLLIIYLGNVTGTSIFAVWLSTHTNIAETSKTLIQGKILKPTGNLLVDSIVCGICIAIAVKGYVKTNSFIPVILGVMVFILSGAEHCIADAFYLAVSNIVPIPAALLFLAIVTFGNILGGAIFAFLE